MWTTKTQVIESWSEIGCTPTQTQTHRHTHRNTDIHLSHLTKTWVASYLVPAHVSANTHTHKHASLKQLVLMFPFQPTHFFSSYYISPSKPTMPLATLKKTLNELTHRVALCVARWPHRWGGKIKKRWVWGFREAQTPIGRIGDRECSSTLARCTQCFTLNIFPCNSDTHTEYVWCVCGEGGKGSESNDTTSYSAIVFFLSSAH